MNPLRSLRSAAATLWSRQSTTTNSVSLPVSIQYAAVRAPVASSELQHFCLAATWMDESCGSAAAKPTSAPLFSIDFERLLPSRSDKGSPAVVSNRNWPRSQAQPTLPGGPAEIKVIKVECERLIEVDSSIEKFLSFRREKNAIQKFASCRPRAVMRYVCEWRFAVRDRSA